MLRIRIRDPMPLWTLDPGIRNRFLSDPRIPDLGSRIPNPYFWEASDKFLGKKFFYSLKGGPNFFLQHFKSKIIYNFCEICGYKKKCMATIFFSSPLSFVAVFGSGIRDPRSWIRDPWWVKIRIRDKHPGSATLGQSSLPLEWEKWRRWP